MVPSMKCKADLCLYCHMPGLKVVSESEVVMELLQHHLRLGIWKANYWFQIWLSSNKILISGATIIPNKSSLLGVDCKDLLMSSIISNALLGFSGACLSSSLCFSTLQCLCHRVSNEWLVKTLKNKLFLEQSLKLSSASVMPLLFGLISATFEFCRLFPVFF